MLLKTEKITAVIVALIMVAVSAWGHFTLPDTPLPVHFGFDGIANGFQARDIALLIHPCLALVLAVVMFWLLPVLLPKSTAIARSATAYGSVVLALLLFLAGNHMLIVMSASGLAVDHARFAFGGTGLLFIIMGNYLPKMRTNRLIGIRTPWTLADDRVWDKTHYLAGRLFMLGGAAIIAGDLLAPQDWRGAILAISVIGTVIISLVYSYLTARNLNLV